MSNGYCLLAEKCRCNGKPVNLCNQWVPAKAPMPSPIHAGNWADFQAHQLAHPGKPYIGKEYHGVLPPKRAKDLPADMVVLPQHYSRWAIEPVYFIGQNKMSFLQGNIIKYACRAEFKHETPVEDLLKDIRYAIMWGKFLLGDPDWAKEYKTDIAAMLKKELSYAAVD